MNGALLFISEKKRKVESTSFNIITTNRVAKCIHFVSDN